MVPYVKTRLAIDEATLGLLLLCLGGGSIFGMQAAGSGTARFGARWVVGVGAAGITVLLPLLTFAPSVGAMGGALGMFGACLGAVDVAMNIEAVEVERLADRPMMSGFHALFSLGGFAGAGLMTMALGSGTSLLMAACAAALIVALAILVAVPRFLVAIPGSGSPFFVLPKGEVVLLASLAGICFLAEGAMLDWSALLLTERDIVEPAHGGLGYGFFAVAMTIGRLSGDRLVARIGDENLLLGGGVIAVAGFSMLLLSPYAGVALIGFALIGLGAANIVPILFRRAGKQTVMAPAAAISAVSLVGYAGVLGGPALVGLVAHRTNLANAFWILAALLCLVPLASRCVTVTKSR